MPRMSKGLMIEFSDMSLTAILLNSGRVIVTIQIRESKTPQRLPMSRQEEAVIFLSGSKAGMISSPRSYTLLTRNLSAHTGLDSWPGKTSTSHFQKRAYPSFWWPGKTSTSHFQKRAHPSFWSANLQCRKPVIPLRSKLLEKVQFSQVDSEDILLELSVTLAFTLFTKNPTPSHI